jgi:hypothetical protein
MRWAKKEQITDGLLQKAIDEVSEGLSMQT